MDVPISSLDRVSRESRAAAASELSEASAEAISTAPSRTTKPHPKLIALVRMLAKRAAAEAVAPDGDQP